VKAEGRGPSVWDVLTHRVTNYVTNNYTADITNNVSPGALLPSPNC